MSGKYLPHHFVTFLLRKIICFSLFFLIYLVSVKNHPACVIVLFLLKKNMPICHTTTIFYYLLISLNQTQHLPNIYLYIFVHVTVIFLCIFIYSLTSLKVHKSQVFFCIRNTIQSRCQCAFVSPRIWFLKTRSVYFVQTIIVAGSIKKIGSVNNWRSNKAALRGYPKLY